MAFDGSILFSLLLGGLLTVVLGVSAMRLLDRAIDRNMAASAAAALPADIVGMSPGGEAGPAPPLSIRIDRVADLHDGPERSRLLGRMVATHIAAGLVFGGTAALILLVVAGLGLLPLRTLSLGWSFAWPMILVACLLVGPDSRRRGALLLAYLGGLVLLCGLSGIVGGTAGVPAAPVPAFALPVLLWAIYATPSLFLLLFLNRRVRTIGPMILIFAAVALLGSQAALTLLASGPGLRAATAFAAQLGLGAGALFWGTAGLGLVIGSWPGWRAVAAIRDRYAAKRLSDMMLTADAIWLWQSLILANSLFREGGLAGTLAGALPFVAWRLALAVGFRRLADAQEPAARSLLLLRVFGHGARSGRLLDLLGTRWRPIGCVDLIAAPDLASRIIDPAIFLLFLQGRLGRLFLRTPDDLDQHLANRDRRRDPDGRFRVNPCFCSGAIWQAAVTRLMADASWVVMDLRSFASRHGGCIFELQTLLDVVALDRLVILIDASTDTAALEAVLRDRWDNLAANSPNRGRAEIRLLDCGTSAARAVRHILSQPVRT